ncbi:MAG: hypothetical protein JW719_02915 [Pirellulales bacterium]|nr:hypothetical protein [Pirellulales bacterium]
MRSTETSLPLLPLVLDRVADELRELLVQEGVPFCDASQQPRAGRFVLFDSRRGRRGSIETGQTWIDVAGLDDGSSGGPIAALADCRSAPHQWRIGSWTVAEEIARIDRRAVRRALLGALRDAIEDAGGVWLCVSAYPFPYRSAFNFRFDHDEYDTVDFEAVFRAIRGREGWTSHFVNGAGHASAATPWARLRGLDVGSHGYWHHTYRTVEENVRNLGRGIEFLRGHGIEPRGFAGPHGRYCPELGAALDALGVSHSGEFGLAYDDLPFCLVPGGPLQVPIHPVCLGLFLEAADRQVGHGPAEAVARRRAAAESAAQYFERLIHERYCAGEPVMLYGHPEGRLGCWPNVLRRVLTAADSLWGLWKTTQADWVAWWEARRNIRLTVTQSGGCFEVAAEGLPADWDIGVECWRSTHVALMRLDRSVVRFTPESLAYERRPTDRRVIPERVDRPGGLRARLRRAIDWERVTPFEDIGTIGWRNRVKRTLRKWVA